METEGEDWPDVSVVMPAKEEARYLEQAVGRILSQKYAGRLEVVIAVAPSRDATRAIAERLARVDERVLVVTNSSGRTPAGLNAALAATRHPVVVRVDGHGELPDGYVASAVQLLQETGADNVGGMMVPEGRTHFERAVAAAMGSRIGIGDAPFHVGGEPGPADTVYLGVFRREALDRLGGFDERFTRAQDWELNLRIRRTGGVVWFSPALRVTYRPRSSLRALAAQFFTTGQWRRQVISEYPGTANLRYLAPPVAVAVLCSGTLAGLVGVLGGPGWLRLGWAAPAGYALVVATATAHLGRRLPWRSTAWVPAVVPTMHLAWGTGFLLGRTRRPPLPPP